MMAAHAVALRGRPVSIISEGKRSVIGGAQFLHSPIPLVTEAEPEFQITFKLRGTAGEYRRKVYGDKPGVPFVSMEGLTDGATQDAWSLRSAYDHLWEGPLGRSAQQNAVTVSPSWLLNNANNFRFIISTIPLNLLCVNPQVHNFAYQEIWISTEDRSDIEEDTVIYNGDTAPSWYRASNIRGVSGTEWSTSGVKPPLPNLILVRKPLWTNCDCWPDMMKVGRYGSWKKGVLVDDAFRDVMRGDIP